MQLEQNGCHVHTQAEEKGKAIFVDGASARMTKESLGIRTVDFRGLYNVLVNKVGTCRVLVRPPMVTANPERIALTGGGLAKNLAGAGFDLVLKEGRNGDDDAVIKDRIAELDPNKVREIVIMTSDKDFVPILRQKATQGIVIHWVSTMRFRPGEQCSGLSRDVIALFNAGIFQFTDLAHHTREIALTQLGKDVVCCSSQGSFSRISVTLTNKDPREHLRLANELRRLKENFTGLAFDVLE